MHAGTDRDHKEASGHLRFLSTLEPRTPQPEIPDISFIRTTLSGMCDVFKFTENILLNDINLGVFVMLTERVFSEVRTEMFVVYGTCIDVQRADKSLARPD